MPPSSINIKNQLLALRLDNKLNIGMCLLTIKTDALIDKCFL